LPGIWRGPYALSPTGTSAGSGGQIAVASQTAAAILGSMSRNAAVLACLFALTGCAATDGAAVGVLPGVGARVFADGPSGAAKVGAAIGLPPFSLILNAATVFIPTWANLAQPSSGEPCRTSDLCAFALFGSVEIQPPTPSTQAD